MAELSNMELGFEVKYIHFFVKSHFVAAKKQIFNFTKKKKDEKIFSVKLTYQNLWIVLQYKQL